MGAAYLRGAVTPSEPARPGCAWKIAYASKGAAGAAIAARNRKVVRSYSCPWCGMWHLTSHRLFKPSTGRAG